MHQVAYVLAVLGVIGGIVSWAFGAVFYVQTLRAISDMPDRRGLMLRAIVAWPFVIKDLRGEAADHSAKVNKAMVAFLVCMIVAITAIAVGTNLARMPR
jgi:hypothetical protein